MAVKTEEKNKTLKKLIEKNLTKLPKVGETIQGTVINIDQKAIYIDIGGVTTGMVRGYERIDESGEYSDLKPGDKVEAYVLELENEKGAMELSLRRAGHKKAWQRLQKWYDDKEKIEVKVIDANKGGLIVLVGKTRGFLPVSQLSAQNYPRVAGGDKNKILEKLKSFVGKTLKAVIIGLDEKEEKLIVSEKEATQEEQEKEIAKYKVGDIVEGEISAITDFGAFIKFDNLEGLIHISEIAWQRIDNPEDIIKVGDKVKAEIIEINKTKIFLSMKKIKGDPWKDVEKKYKVGDIVEGKILKINPFGLFVELDKDIHGLAHISELADGAIPNLKDFAKVGEVKKFKIISLEPKEHRLGLSLKAVKAGSTKKAEKKTEKEAKEVKAEKSEKAEKEKKEEKAA